MQITMLDGYLAASKAVGAAVDGSADGKVLGGAAGAALSATERRELLASRAAARLGGGAPTASSSVALKVEGSGASEAAAAAAYAEGLQSAGIESSQAFPSQPISGSLLLLCCLWAYQSWCAQEQLQYTVLIGVCRTLFIGVGMFLVDRAGRRPLLLCSTFGIAVALFILAIGAD